MLLPYFRRRARKTGFTILETTAAVGFLGAFIAILIVVGSNVLSLLRTSKDNVSASQTLQQRAEQLRLVGWKELTNPAVLAADIFSNPTPSSSGLSEPIETVVISPFPAKMNFLPVKVVRENGASKVVSTNTAMAKERIVRVDVTLSWKGFPKKRDRKRETSILISKPAES